MRTTLALWWIVIALGIGTYFVWYSGGSVSAATPSKPSAPATAAVLVHNFAFEPATLTIPAGTIVVWTDELGRHTVESADGFLGSGTLIAGGTYQKRFDRPGTYAYYCANHGNKNGTGMSGQIVVTAK
jgi:plastocyanin